MKFRNMKIFSHYLPKLALLMSLFFCGATSAEVDMGKRPLEFGVFPHLSEEHLEENFGAIASRLQQTLGRRINFNTKLSLAYFFQDLEKGRYDLVFLQPFDYVKAHERNGYQALATQTEKLKAILAVRPRSGISKISHLKGRTILLPPEHTAISYLVKDWLKDTGYVIGKDIFLKYESTHVSCMQKALFGFAEVCATARPVIGFMREKLGFEFNTLTESQGIPHALFAVHPRTSEKEQLAILNMLLNLEKDEEGKQILKTLRLKRFRKVRDAEYDSVRRIRARIDGE